MSERDLLIQKLKLLIKTNDIKQKEYQQKYRLSAECACLTKEACIMASLLPRMNALNVTFENCF